MLFGHNMTIGKSWTWWKLKFQENGHRQVPSGQFRRCRKKEFMKSSKLDSEVKHTVLRYKNSFCSIVR